MQDAAGPRSPAAAAAAVAGGAPLGLGGAGGRRGAAPARRGCPPSPSSSSSATAAAVRAGLARPLRAAAAAAARRAPAPPPAAAARAGNDGTGPWGLWGLRGAPPQRARLGAEPPLEVLPAAEQRHLPPDLRCFHLFFFYFFNFFFPPRGWDPPLAGLAACPGRSLPLAALRELAGQKHARQSPCPLPADVLGLFVRFFGHAEKKPRSGGEPQPPRPALLYRGSAGQLPMPLQRLQKPKCIWGLERLGSEMCSHLFFN